MNSDDQAKLLAAALYEIRILLSGRVGAVDGTPETEAAAIAYALHNEALAVAEAGRSTWMLHPENSPSSTKRVGTNATARLMHHLGDQPG